MKLHVPLRLLAALSLAGASLFAQAADVTIAYQTTVDPAKVAQADGAYEKATHAKIDWRKFDNGADIIAAIASGDVQIGYLGSSPLTAAVTRKVPVETFLIATQIGGAEALVARNGSGINSPQDLVGKNRRAVRIHRPLQPVGRAQALEHRPVESHHPQPRATGDHRRLEAR